jgi:hypothetical protein
MNSNRQAAARRRGGRTGAEISSIKSEGQQRGQRQRAIEWHRRAQQAAGPRQPAPAASRRRPGPRAVAMQTVTLWVVHLLPAALAHTYATIRDVGYNIDMAKSDARGLLDSWGGSTSAAAAADVDPPPCTIARERACAGGTGSGSGCLDLQRFRREYGGREPVLISGLLDGWAAQERWGTKEEFLRKHGWHDIALATGVQVSTSLAFLVGDDSGAHMPLGAAVEAMVADPTLFVFDSHSDETIRALLKDTDGDSGGGSFTEPRDLFPDFTPARGMPKTSSGMKAKLGEEHGNDAPKNWHLVRAFIVGCFLASSTRAPGSSCMHGDLITGAAAAVLFRRHQLSFGADGAGLGWHLHGQTWLGLVRGRKHWCVYRPGRATATARGHPMHNSSGWLREVYPQVSAVAVFQPPGRRWAGWAR